MGMFSYNCLGCGGEMREGELVRMSGQVQEYDGYGGFTRDTDKPGPCWHEFCYQRIPFSERRTEDSPRAENQGFGYPRLIFLPGYDEDRRDEQFYTATMEVMLGPRKPSERTREACLHLVRTAKGNIAFRCSNAWYRRWTTFNEKVEEVFPTQSTTRQDNPVLHARRERYYRILEEAEIGKAPRHYQLTSPFRESIFRTAMFFGSHMWRTRDVEAADDTYRYIYVFGRAPSPTGARPLVGEVFASRQLRHPEVTTQGSSLNDLQFMDFWKEKNE